MDSVIPEAIVFNIPYIHPSLLMSFLTWGILILMSYLAFRKASLQPGKLQIMLELLLSYVFDLSDQIIGQKGKRYYPLFAGMFIFILVSNIIGLIPGLSSPTANPNTTFGLAIAVFVYYTFEGIRVQGLDYFKQFLGPRLPWYFFPVTILLVMTEVISAFTRPFSLGLRLFCNIFSKELFLSILVILIAQFILSPVLIDRWFSLGPLLLRPFILLLGLVIGIIQALVFTLLTISYIGGAVQAAEH
ncbi:MAG: F0F1 ATP synthase subunit A [Fibrobacter sp.]|jgi:F-type H+-transporting ATPase subunit a|nr:F0F1 ATP synthase subunit A [Fibrobacter sp.]HON09848.1 F0F1 ATP synthase subunit A [Chitinispirillaceae bacterium]